MPRMEIATPTLEKPREIDRDAEICLRGTTKILIGGMDGAGKSTLACSTYIALRQMGYDVSLHELDPWSDTHAPILGIKPWSERRKRSKVWRTTYEKTIQPFFEDESEIVLGDMQGRYQYTHNGLLAGSADHGVLVTRHATDKDSRIKYPQNQESWEELFANLGIPISLRVHTLLPDQQPPSGVQTVTGLEREPLPDHPDIQACGNLIVKLAQARSDEVFST